MKTYLLLLFAGLFALPSLQAQQVPTWYNAKHERKVDSLINLMTLEEKVGQMTLFTSDWVKTGPTLREGYQADIEAGKCGAIFNAHTVDYNRKLQEMAVNGTRLGIPLIFGYDVIHGYRTIFPIPLGEAASFNPEAARESSAIAAKEASAAGLHWTFAPMVDIARDPRWGRVMEGAGEDVHLGNVMAAARVRGFQGDNLADPTTVLACAKHFAAYGAAQAGRDYHTVDISERVLEEVYLPPFKATVDAGVATFMTSFNELDGVPASMNDHLLTDILRERWGFMGFVVTDYTSINEMVPHGIVKDEAEAGMMAAKAGVDMDMQGAVFYNYLAEQVEAGKVSMADVDEAVRRVLRMKYAAGLFDDPYAYFNKERQESSILTAEHRAVARRIARESMVLLKNENNALPLKKSARRVLLTGPLADSKADMLGAWHGDGQASECITLLEGMKGMMTDPGQLTYVKEMEAAIAAASKADVIVVAAGETERQSGEARSRSDINLPGNQEEMIRRLAATGKPVVIVLFNGRPLTLTGTDETATAILEAWFPGTEAGNAVADVLFGDYNPAGKLPMTFPRSVGQVPIYYSAKNTGRPQLNPDQEYVSKYLDESNLPLYPFGYGKSYTTFSYDEPQLSATEINRNGKLTVSVTVSNTGSVDGHEVVQLYLKDHVGSTTRPVRELKAFQRVMIPAGGSTMVTFDLDNEHFSFYRRDRTYGSEPGQFTVFVGGDSTTENGAEFSLSQPSLKR